MTSQKAMAKLAQSNIEIEVFTYIVNHLSANCRNCKWHQDEVCVNDESRLVAEFVSVDDICKLWEIEK